MQAKHGFTRLFGIDYAEDAVALARLVLVRAGVTAHLQTVDVLAPGGPIVGAPFGVALDKGTYDAVSLRDNCSELGASRASIRQAYAHAVHALTEPGGLFIITSCNWTEAELRCVFEQQPQQQLFAFIESLPYAQFRLGGRAGQTVSTVIFRRQ